MSDNNQILIEKILKNDFTEDEAIEFSRGIETNDNYKRLSSLMEKLYAEISVMPSEFDDGKTKKMINETLPLDEQIIFPTESELFVEKNKTKLIASIVFIVIIIIVLGLIIL